MRQPDSKRSRKNNETQEETDRPKPALFQCAELILPWLTPLELANVSLTCRTLHQISKSITLSRSSDACRAFENIAIPFCNAVDSHPYAYFIYTHSLILPSSSSSQFQRQFWGSNFSRIGVESVGLVDELGENVSGCDCESCNEVGDGDTRCPCSSLDGLDVVRECGSSCRCGLECGNRLSQKRITIRLKVVRDRRKGWGLHSDQLIQKGQFVCEYAGELLTTKEARRQHQLYDELACSGHSPSALLVIREHLPSGNACLRINIDATRIGNVARFINHSCDGGNLSTTLMRSSGALIPRLCFFASRDIKEGEELTFSYGEIRKKSKGLQCFCGSSSCFGMLPSEDT
ncbi:Histone-lysine N-methyltransferase [Quillaja saponaria]|uniref:Histone-lysine N-methyltransferase n=1 Tax=Quillaja saponaria TaxID=32244 RepID=A0AAD7PZB3_QUISA|nr:Histone-lysine N-methyltransferase [Quillaja saponaria]